MRGKNIYGKQTPLESRMSERGSAAIEFALVAPVLVIILIGILCYGVYYGAANSVQQIAADAARASVAGLTDQERSSLARARVQQHAPSFVLIDASRLSVTASSSSANADLFEVSISYDTGDLAIWAFSGVVPLPPRVIVRTSAIQRGGY